MFKLVHNCQIYNYADDNTLSCSHSNLDTVIKSLELSSKQAIEWFGYNSMLANPDKFQAIILQPGRKSETLHTFNFENTSIVSEPSVKILGITIDDKLNFTPHIKDICSKAARQLNVLKRLSSLLDFNSRMAIFRSFILSNFNYCPIIWHHCGQANTQKLERLQLKALKFVYDCTNQDITYEELLKKANLSSLLISRLRLIAVEVYKIVHKKSPEILHELVSQRQPGTYNLRGTNVLNVPRVKTTRFGIHSFKYQAAKIWNSLPEGTRCSITLPQFRTQIKTWYGPQCKCSACKSQQTRPI